MKSPLAVNTGPAIPEFLLGGGETGKLIRAYDWCNTSLGPVETWPQSLQSALSICLNSNFPIAIYWGKDLVLLYNEAWKPIPGNKHPWALGKPAKEVWPEIWDAIEPQFQKAFNGLPGGSKDALLPMQRHGYVEECYFDFTFTPIYGEAGKVEGVFNAVIETTKNILNERQLRTLTELGKALIDSRSHTEVIEDTIKTLNQNPYDFPFALFRSIENNKAILASSTPLGEAEKIIPKVVNLNENTNIASTIKDAVASRKLQVFEGLKEKIGELPAGAWNLSPDKAIVIPVMQAGMKEPYGILVVGLNPFRIMDENYSGFFSLVADQMATGFAQVNVLEEERKRAEALAEIDKAKTTFFTNISHEFRTPLTLMLGTIEEALNDPNTIKKNLERMQVTHRSAMRLLKLVNTLLDFSRLEAGKVKPFYQLTDIIAFTKALASGFRSTIENAGLQFHVVCDTVIQPVYIDKEMWEKIVLNLLSNAFKYTLNGSITLSLTTNNSHVVLKVKDTGVGIPKEELPKMFQRFHRVQQNKGRTFEGSGIGLSFVKELVQLHGGTISVHSEEGKGSEFIVSIPTGKAHVSREQVAEKAIDFNEAIKESFIEEMAALIDTPVSEKDTHQKTVAATVLVVDDNADMRNYIKRLLQEHFTIITASNGMDALLKLKEHKVDLVVSDVMMPIMDGIQLLKTIKAMPHTSTLPVILVSARAGEEAKVEGFDMGADDYLIKPFSAKELVARVRSQITIAKKRDNVLHDVYKLFDEVPFAVAALKGPDLTIDYINQYNLDIWQQPKEEVLGKPLFEARPDIKASAEAIHNAVYETGKRFEAKEIPVQITNNNKTEVRYFNAIIDPMKNEEGKIVGQIATSIDITHYKTAEEKIKTAQEQLKLTIENVPAAIYLFDKNGSIVYLNTSALNTLKKILGEEYNHNDDLNSIIQKSIPNVEYFDDENNPLSLDQYPMRRVLQTAKEATQLIKRCYKKTGTVDWIISKVVPVLDDKGALQFILSTATEITEQKEAEEKIRDREERFRTLAEALPQMIWMRRLDGTVEYGSKNWERYSGISNVSEAWKAMTHPDDWDPVMKEWEAAQTTNKGLKYEVRLKNKEGEYRWHSGTAEPLRDSSGKVIKWIGALTDIHHQKTFAEKLEKEVAQRTKELQNSQSFLQQLIDSSVEYISVLDKELKFITVNKSFEEKMGINRDELKGKYLFDFNPKAKGTIQHQSIIKALAGETIYLDKRTAVAIPDIYIDTYFIPLRMEECVEGVIIMARDVTNVVHTENKLEDAIKELQRSNEDLLQFAHVTSHDLKEPVRKIRMFENRLRQEFDSVLPEGAKVYLSKIAAAGSRMYDMIDGVLLYSSLNALDQQKEEVHLNRVFHQIEIDLEVMIQHKKAIVSYPNLPNVEGYPVLLYQLFYNILANSLKFSRAGVAPVVKVEADYLNATEATTLFLNTNKTYVKITVKDNGIGFNQTDGEKIFQTFFRLHPKDKYEGTGLGLALSKKIVDRHGGLIKAKGKEGEGSVFTVILPLR